MTNSKGLRSEFAFIGYVTNKFRKSDGAIFTIEEAFEEGRVPLYVKKGTTVYIKDWNICNVPIVKIPREGIRIRKGSPIGFHARRRKSRIQENFQSQHKNSKYENIKISRNPEGTQNLSRNVGTQVDYPEEKDLTSIIAWLSDVRRETSVESNSDSFKNPNGTQGSEESRKIKSSLTGSESGSLRNSTLKKNTVDHKGTQMGSRHQLSDLQKLSAETEEKVEPIYQNKFEYGKSNIENGTHLGFNIGPTGQGGPLHYYEHPVVNPLYGIPMSSHIALPPKTKVPNYYDLHPYVNWNPAQIGYNSTIEGHHFPYGIMNYVGDQGAQAGTQPKLEIKVPSCHDLFTNENNYTINLNEMGANMGAYMGTHSGSVVPPYNPGLLHGNNQIGNINPIGFHIGFPTESLDRNFLNGFSSMQRGQDDPNMTLREEAAILLRSKENPCATPQRGATANFLFKFIKYFNRHCNFLVIILMCILIFLLACK